MKKDKNERSSKPLPKPIKSQVVWPACHAPLTGLAAVSSEIAQRNRETQQA